MYGMIDAGMNGGGVMDLSEKEEIEAREEFLGVICKEQEGYTKHKHSKEGKSW